MEGKKGISELPQITHTGKYAVVYDVAHKKGALYYLSMVGSRQMTEGIAAALLDSGKRNKQDVNLQLPDEGEGKSSARVWRKSQRVKVADHAFGTMRRIVRKVQGTRVFQTVLVSQLARWDYNYSHITAKSEIADDSETSEHKQVQEEADKRRFVLLADSDEDIEYTARRWFAYLPRRVNEPMLADWAVPLWEHCNATDKGISEISRLRGNAWLCEPTRENLRDAITELGSAGNLALPSDFPDYLGDGAYEMPEYDVAAD